MDVVAAPGKARVWRVANGHSAGRGRRSMRPPRHLGCASASPGRKEPPPSSGFTPRTPRPHPPRSVAHDPNGATVSPEAGARLARSQRRPDWARRQRSTRKPRTLETSELSEFVSRSTPPLASPGPRPAGTSRPVVDVRWIAFAQVLLKIGHPSGEVATQPSFGKEPEPGRGMIANPLTVVEPTHVPASTGDNQTSHEDPPQDCQHIPQRVRQLLPSQPVQIPVSHFTHLQPGRPNRASREPCARNGRTTIRRNT